MMKTMKQMTSLLLAMLLTQLTFAQGDIVTNAAAGQAFTITSTQNASAVNAIRYQWYRNGALIPGATGASYTIPAAYAYGDMVRFQRMATTTECAGTSEAFSNSVTITFQGFIMPAGCQLVIGGVCWADRNVDNFSQFATRADMYTKYYQWGKITPYSGTDPLTPAWDNTINDAMTWDNAWDPCPMGWRMPSKAEADALLNAGSSVVSANQRGNAVPGIYAGYNNATCQLPNNMNGCIFLPAGGRNANAGDLAYQTNTDLHSLIWTNTPYDSNNAYFVYRNTGGTAVNTYTAKNRAWTIRCVQ